MLQAEWLNTACMSPPLYPQVFPCCHCNTIFLATFLLSDPLFWSNNFSCIYLILPIWSCALLRWELCLIFLYFSQKLSTKTGQWVDIQHMFVICLRKCWIAWQQEPGVLFLLVLICSTQITIWQNKNRLWCNFWVIMRWHYKCNQPTFKKSRQMVKHSMWFYSVCSVSNPATHNFSLSFSQTPRVVVLKFSSTPGLFSVPGRTEYVMSPALFPLTPKLHESNYLLKIVVSGTNPETKGQKGEDHGLWCQPAWLWVLVLLDINTVTLCSHSLPKARFLPYKQEMITVPRAQSLIGA